MASKISILNFKGVHNAYAFLMKELSSDKVSVTVSKLSVYFTHTCTMRCFHLHYAVPYLTNVNLNVPLTNFYGF